MKMTEMARNSYLSYSVRKNVVKKLIPYACWFSLAKSRQTFSNLRTYDNSKLLWRYILHPDFITHRTILFKRHVTGKMREI
jgi:hypothetical protein